MKTQIKDHPNVLKVRPVGGRVFPMADLELVEYRARHLMTKHGVGRLSFEWDRATTRIGATHSRRVLFPTGEKVVPEKITLSKPFVERMDMADVEDVILHEIAHALTPGTGHGDEWKWKCVELGIEPTRCKATGITFDKPVKGICPKCDKTISQMHRLPQKVYVCGECKQIPQIERVLVWYKNGTKVKTRDMPERYYNTLTRYREKANSNV